MLRYFGYLDERGIETLYNQFENSIDKNVVTVNKGHKGASRFNIGLSNFIKGIISGGASADIESTSSISDETTSMNSIEKKVIELIKLSHGNEQKAFNNSLFRTYKQLVIGEIKAVEFNCFSAKYKRTLTECDKAKISKDDIKILYSFDNKMKDEWEKVVMYINSRLPMDRTNMPKTLRRLKYNELLTYVILNNSFPIIMDLSFSKIKSSTSDFRVSPFYSSQKEFNVMGLLENLSDDIYHLKPLALWNIVGVNDKDCY